MGDCSDEQKCPFICDKNHSGREKDGNEVRVPRSSWSCRIDAPRILAVAIFTAVEMKNVTNLSAKANGGEGEVSDTRRVVVAKNKKAPVAIGLCMLISSWWGTVGQ